MRRLWKTFLALELETAGNIFFEFGTDKDPWFNYCQQLLRSRFCASDYTGTGVGELNVFSVVRISNRHQRYLFDLKLESAIVDKHENLWQLTMLEISRRANIEYLIWLPRAPDKWSKRSTWEYADLMTILEDDFSNKNDIKVRQLVKMVICIFFYFNFLTRIP